MRTPSTLRQWSNTWTSSRTGSRRCQRGANSPKRGRHQPRKCWDSPTGFGAGHVHAATSKPKAYSKRIVLDEVQRRVPHCDVYLALRRVTEGFGGGSQRWARDDGDDRLKEDTDAALLLRGPSPRRSTLLTRNLRRHQHPSKRTRASLTTTAIKEGACSSLQLESTGGQ